MKKIIFIVLSVMISSFMYAQTMQQQADAAYSNGNFTQAIELYKELASKDGVSASLYYNIGNAYFKDKDIAQAILYYERALLLDPNDADAKFNLAMAQSQVIDKIEPVGKFFISQWYDSIKETLSSNEWAYIAAGSFILAIIAIALYVFNKILVVRKIGFFGGFVLLCISIFANIFASSQKEKIEKREFAVVMSPTVTVKGSPADSGTELFVIHEGTKVKVKSTLSNWSEIEIADGNVGWLQSSSIEKI